MLIHRARAKGARKRGRHARRRRPDHDLPAGDDGSAEILDVDDALTRLAAEKPSFAELVNLRFFAGLTLEEPAGVLGFSA